MFSQPSYLGSRCLFWKEGFTGPLCPSCLYRGSPWRGRWGHPATRLSHQTTQQHTQPSSLLSAQHENTSLNKKKGRKKLETAEQQMGRMGLGSFLIPLPKPDPATPHTWTQPLGQCHPPFLSARNHSWMLTSPKGSTGAVMGPAGSCAALAGLFPFGSRMHIGKMLGEALGVPKSQGVVLSPPLGSRQGTSCVGGSATPMGSAATHGQQTGCWGETALRVCCLRKSKWSRERDVPKATAVWVSSVFAVLRDAG